MTEYVGKNIQMENVTWQDTVDKAKELGCIIRTCSAYDGCRGPYMYYTLSDGNGRRIASSPDFLEIYGWLLEYEKYSKEAK